MSFIKKRGKFLFFLIIVFAFSLFSISFLVNDDYVGIYDNNGNTVSTKIVSVQQIVDGELKKVSFKQDSEDDIVFPPGLFNVEIEPDIAPIKSIKIFELNTSNNFNFGIDDVPETGDFEKWIEVYAIDPTKLEFKNATVTAVAKGTTLWKCKDYNFKKQNCYGRWIKIMDISPGKAYSFILTKEDPIYAEAATIVECYKDGVNVSCSVIDSDIISSNDVRGYLDVGNSSYSYVQFNFGDMGVNASEPLLKGEVLVEYFDEFNNFTNQILSCYNGTGWENATNPPINTTEQILVFNLTDNCYKPTARANDIRVRFGFWPTSAAPGRVYFDWVMGRVTTGNSSTPPEVFNLIPASGTIFDINDTIEISADVTDDIEVDRTYVNITFPNGTVERLNLTNSAGDKYIDTFTIPDLKGQYNVLFIANDTYGNVNSTETTYFNIQKVIAGNATPEAGSLSGTYQSFSGTYVETKTSDDSYYAVEGKQTPPVATQDLIGNMTLSYDLSSINASVIDYVNGSIVYCHADSISSGCSGGNPAAGTAGAMNIYAYNVSSSSWIDIGDINKTTDNVEATAVWEIDSVMSDFINSSGWIDMKFEFNLNDGDSAFLIDYAPLLFSENQNPTINSISAVPNPANVNSTITLTANVTDNYQLDIVKFRVTLPNNTVRNFYLNDTWQFDGFEDGNADGWETNTSNPTYPGNWTVKLDSGNYIYQQVDSDPAKMYAYISNKSFDDFTYSADVRITEPYNTGRSVGILFKWNSYGNYYLFDHYSGNLRLIAFNNDLPNVLNTTAFSLTGNTWYNFKAVVINDSINDSINVYIDEVLRLSATDNSLGNGTVGFRLQDYSGEFDNVTVLRENEMYRVEFDETSDTGTYNFRVYANDTSANNAQSQNSPFVISSPYDNPKVANLTPTPGTNFSDGTIVNITANVTDPEGIDTVVANITYGLYDDSCELIDSNNDSIYVCYYNNTDFVGDYVVLIIANDTEGNINSSETTNFTITDASPPVIHNVTVNPDPAVQYQFVNLTANITDNVAVANVTFEIRLPNGTATNYSSTKLLFSDGFEDGNDSGYIKNTSNPSYPGVWTVENVSGNMVYRQSQTDIAQYYSTLAGENYTDISYSAMVRAIDQVEAGKSIGILFRFQDIENYYMFDHYNSEFRIIKKYNDSNFVLANTAGSLAQDQWYNFSVVVIGNEIQAYVDGNLTLSVTDNDLSSGNIGVRLQQYQAEFDNLTLEDRRSFFYLRYNETDKVGTYDYNVYATDVNSFSSAPYSGNFYVGGAVLGNLTMESGEQPLFKSLSSANIDDLNLDDSSTIQMKAEEDMVLTVQDVNSSLPITAIGQVDIIVDYSTQAGFDANGVVIEAREASQVGELWCSMAANESVSEKRVTLDCYESHFFDERDLNNIFIVIRNNHTGGQKRLYVDYVLINYTYSLEEAFAVRIHSPKNKVYENDTVLLNFSTYNGAYDWCGYSFNGAANVSISNSSTVNLTGFIGTNNVKVYCNNTNGTMVSDETDFVIGEIITLHPLEAVYNSSYITYDLFAVDNIYTTIGAGELVNVSSSEKLVPEDITSIGDASAYCYVKQSTSDAQVYFNLQRTNFSSGNVCYQTINATGYLECDLQANNITSIDHINELEFSCHVNDTDGGNDAEVLIDEAFVNVTAGRRLITSDASIILSSPIVSPGVNLSIKVHNLTSSSNVTFDIITNDSSVAGYPKLKSSNASGYAFDSWIADNIGTHLVEVNDSSGKTIESFEVRSNYTIAGQILDAASNAVNSDIKLFFQNGTLIDTVNNTYNFTLDYGRKYKINVTPENHLIRSARFKGVANVGMMDDLVLMHDTTDNGVWNELYSIKPRLKFDNATIKADASGNSKNKILYKCDEWDFENQNCTGSWKAWQAFTPGQEYTITIYPGDPGLAEVNGTFFEGFESGSLATNNWTNTGSGTDWTIDTAPYAGTYNIRAKNTIAESIIETNISTANYDNITFSFYAETSALDTGEYIAADWYNGTAWINAMPQTQDITTYTFYSYNLTNDANNNSNFQIRFRCLNNANNKKCYVDNIQIDGDYINIMVNETTPGLELVWLDPDGEINREQNIILEADGQSDYELSFIQNIFGSVYSIFVGE
jgi:hypothetical protein